MVTYNGTTNELHIYLVKSADSTKGYEVYPDSAGYISKALEKISIYKNKHKNREAQSECFSVLLNIIL